jgi:sucrose-6-phosphate hydrolase SacC (GH32 family)
MIGWMNQGNNSVFQKAGMPFNQQMSFPNTMELRTTPEGVRLYRWPVKEVEKLYTKSYKFKNLSVEKTEKELSSVKAELIDLSIEFEPKNSIKLIIRGLEVAYDQKSGMFAFGTSKVAAPTIDGKVKLRVLLDRASIELFANEGAAVSTCYAVPEVGNYSISLSADGNTKINSLVINELKSSWIK